MGSSKRAVWSQGGQGGGEQEGCGGQPGDFVKPYHTGIATSCNPKRSVHQPQENPRRSQSGCSCRA